MYSKAFDGFVEPARKFPEIWRLLLGSIVVAIVYLICVGMLIGAIWLVVGSENSMVWIEKLVEASTPTGTVLLFASFIGMALGPIVAAKFLHKRPASSLFGVSAVVLRDFLHSLAVLAFAYGALTIAWLIQYDAVPNLDLTIWLSFLPLALAGLLIQTGAEELVFRGYLQQQLAARFRSPLIWMLVPSAIFAAIHYDPSRAGDNAWLMVLSAGAFGIIAADLTRVTGSIGAAWGFHFANNMFAMLFISVQGTLPGLALYVTPYSVTDLKSLPWLVGADLVMMGVAWLILRRTLRR